MDGQSFLDDLRSDHETALSRLGSSKSVYALTGGEMDGDVLQSELTSELRAIAETTRTWADGAGTTEAADLFGDVAAFATDHAEGMESAAGEAKGGSGAATEGTEAADRDRSALAGSLADPEDDVARAGALAGGLLVLGKLSEQLVGFFVGDADPRTADEFRDFRSEVESLRDEAATSLETLCTDDDDREAARNAADATIEAAYDWYVETLEAMGVKPKNVC